MKSVFKLSVIVLLGFNSYGQTHVFEKNLELARVHEKTSNSICKISVYTLNEGNISEDLLAQIAERMAEKDGYIELSKVNDSELQLTHESFLTDSDIRGVLNQLGITFNRKKINDFSVLK